MSKKIDFSDLNKICSFSIYMRDPKDRRCYFKDDVPGEKYKPIECNQRNCPVYNSLQDG